MDETEALRALMEADRWIDKVVAQRSHLPELAELAEVERALRSLASALRDVQQSQTPVRAAYEQSADEANRLRSRERDLAATLASSTANARELTALQTEVEHVRQLLTQVEDRELDLLMQLEPMDQSIADIKEQAQPLAMRRSELQSQIEALQGSLDDELGALRTSRSHLTAPLSGPVLTRYEAALTRSGTSGAAQVVSGRCDGCRIALSPLDLDRWRALGADDLMACPECGRILLP